jgi:preprotein translocase subunit SecF
MRILTNVNVDWLRWRWHTLALSWLIIISGITLMVMRGVPLGIDFSGGTNVVVRFDRPVSDDAVRDALSAIPGEKQIQRYGDPADNEKLIKLPQTTEAEEAFDLEKQATAVEDSLRGANLGKFERRSLDVVGPVIGQDLQRKGIYATILSLLGIMSYIWLRFRFSFGTIRSSFSTACARTCAKTGASRSTSSSTRASTRPCHAP